MASHKLRYPAPKRAYEQTDNGYSSHPWETWEVASALEGGAWFDMSSPSAHEFASPKARDLALGGSIGLNTGVNFK